MKKILNLWKETNKFVIFILVGLVPAIVFKVYASPGEVYDSFYTIIIWIILILSELCNNYVASKEENNEDETEG